ncbi:ras-like GTP-binding protein Rho1 [Clytia hemisphaerica]|uniref:Uncharacterized protein n=1 Tax=Clytia hemisphaerica TaxID=252671 RepID=A0A7M5XGJ0_9CNID|eukprot:TCONS_00015707-protein
MVTTDATQQQTTAENTPTHTTSGCKKVVVVGDGSCGKTCLLMSIIERDAPDGYVPTVFETYVKEIDHGKTSYEVSFYDTAGQDVYDRLRPLSYPDTDVFLVCFAVDSPDSLYNAYDKWTPEVKHFGPNVPFVLVGTKCDLRSDESTLKRLRKAKQEVITQEEGREMAKKLKASAYVECSALTGFNVNEVISTALKSALKKQHKQLNKLKQLRCTFL